MKITKTAKLKITSHTNIFNETISIYNKALDFYISVCEKEYGHLEQFKHSKEKLNYIEAITHLTAKNQSIKYDFDKDFYRFPSYVLERGTSMYPYDGSSLALRNSKKDIAIFQNKNDKNKTYHPDILLCII